MLYNVNMMNQNEELGSVVVTKNPDGQIVAVTLQDEEGRILRVIAESEVHEVDPKTPADMQVNSGALKLALDVLRRAGKNEVADELEKTAVPTQDVQEKIDSNTWDNFKEIVPTLNAIHNREWGWGRNSRCKYVSLRIDTRDLGCLLFDANGVRISPEQFAFQKDFSIK